LQQEARKTEVKEVAYVLKKIHIQENVVMAQFGRKALDL
jgi:hypothetical protein